MDGPPHVSPERIGKYRVSKVLGEGMQAVTYLAYAPADQVVAIKVLRAEKASSKSTRRAMDREVRATKEVSVAYRPNIIDYRPSEAQPYLVMEYIDGPTLDDLIATVGPLSDDQLERMVVKVAEILAAVHSVGVAHGDLRGQNLIVSGGGIYLVDFGRAALRSSKRSRFRKRRRYDLLMFGALIGRAGSGKH